MCVYLCIVCVCACVHLRVCVCFAVCMCIYVRYVHDVNRAAEFVGLTVHQLMNDNTAVALNYGVFQL